jgi:uncharacterized protein YxeA
MKKKILIILLSIILITLIVKANFMINTYRVAKKNLYLVQERLDKATQTAIDTINHE